MLFFRSRVLLGAAITAFALLQLTVARPLLENGLIEDNSLVKRDDPSTRIRLADSASKDLDKMGLHGKPRRNMIKWHKKIIKEAMANEPGLKDKAHTGEIQRIAHKGGSNPEEKNHITASFRDKHNNVVLNTFDGNKNHHVYVNSQKGLMRQGKTSLNKLNAHILGQSPEHQNALGKTRTPGKSSNKGKGKQKKN